MIGKFIKRILVAIYSFLHIDLFIVKTGRYFITILTKNNGEILDDLKSDYFQKKAQNVLANIVQKGHSIKINGDVHISHPQMVLLGKNIHIGNNAYFFTRGGLTIGDNVHISRNVTIYTANHQYEGKALPYENSYRERAVIIERNVWIGMNVSIIPGVIIGEGAIIGMGVVVTKNVEAYSIIGTNNQRLLKERDIDHYNSLLNEQAFGGVNGRLINHAKYDELGKSPSNLGSNLVFAVGTGRCGSMALSTLLNDHKDIQFKHEPNGQLIKLSTDFEHGVISEDDVTAKIKAMYTQSSFVLSRIYGESDQKISNLISIIHRLFPEAKFVWMLRNARSTVESTYSRGWFDDAEFGYERREDLAVDKVYSSVTYSENRLNGYKVGVFGEEEWVKMSPFERNCWYWRYWNERISHQLKSIPQKNWRLQKIESLDADVHEIFEFLDVEYVDLGMPKKINPTFYPMTRSENWDDEMDGHFNRWCAELNDRLYPESV